MRLVDVLTHFNLELLGQAPEGVLDRPVVGAHALEVPNPIRHVPPQWILLSSCMRLYRKPKLQRELIQELHAGSITALGFGVGVAFDHPPEALIDEAQKLGFPVFIVAEEMPFRNIIRHVDSQLLGSDLHTLRQSIALHDQMLADLAGPDPESAIVRDMARMLRCSVSLYTEVGQVVATSDRTDTTQVWERLGDCEQHTNAFWRGAVSLVRGGDLVACRVEIDGVAVRWLVATSGVRALEDAVIERAVHEGGAMLATYHRMQTNAARRRRRERSASFRAILDGVAGHPDAEGEHTHSSEVVTDVDLGVRGSVSVVTTSNRGGVGAALEAVELELSRQRKPYLVAELDGNIVIWTATGQNLLRTLEESGLTSWSVGVGRPTSCRGDIRHAYLEARLAAGAAERRGACSVVEFAELGLIDSLLVDAVEEQVLAKARGVLQGLQGQSELEMTLLCYFRTGMNSTETARELHLHKNSLRYRLQRIEHFLGRDLRRPQDIAEVSTALSVIEVYGQ
jgi:PucR family transcriptional regulator, purine catabolism regulatory protein